VVTIKLGGVEFRVELARTSEQRSKGLMGRKHLGAQEGMLFVYNEDQRLSFWMKNTSIPLSIAFLDRHGRIMQIEEMHPFDPTPVRSKISVRYALEVRQGTFASLGARVGDSVELPSELR
jgi:uncharacterized membrane protein (UPF0127 family)